MILYFGYICGYIRMTFTRTIYWLVVICSWIDFVFENKYAFKYHFLLTSIIQRTKHKTGIQIFLFYFLFKFNTFFTNISCYYTFFAFPICFHALRVSTTFKLLTDPQVIYAIHVIKCNIYLLIHLSFLFYLKKIHVHCIPLLPQFIT